MQRLHRLHILAIDEDGVDLHLLKRTCEDVAGWEVEFSGYGMADEALRALARRRVDVIFVSYRLGAINGLEIVRRLRAEDEIRPIIFLTATGSELVAKESIRIGADDYLSKHDLSPGLIRRTVEGAINQYHYRRERALLERELREAQKMEAIGTLTAGLAHDFNNMLAGLLGDTQLAQRKNEDAGVGRHLDNIQRACQRMAALIHRLLTFRHSSSTTLSVVSLKLVIDHTLAILLHTLPANIQLETELPDDPLWLEATPAGLQQVIMNLCINAAEAMKDGGCITLSVEKTFANGPAGNVSGADAKTWLRLQVRDTGAGIDPQYRERIFDPFFTTKAMGARKGTGLGLAIVWQLVRDFGGWIHVDSEPQCGACFSVYLASTDLSVPGPERDTVGLPRGSETVLVVDDEAAVLEATAGMLEHLGYSVLTSPDGPKALAALQQQSDRIACILLDFSLPDMNGMECGRQIQALAPGLPIVFTSGHDLKPHLATLADTGARAALQKPYALSELAHCVRGVLDTRAADDV
jgi:signal transduction histidine kinase